MLLKIVRRIVRWLDSLIDNSILIGCLFLFLIGFYALYDSYMVYQNANDSSILKYKPGYGSEEDVDKEILDDMVAWLTLDDTNVDYPVMQGETNNDYLNKDPFGDYSLSGSIFLDSRNSADFTDDYSLVYGHHMEGGMMFGALDDYLDEEFFKSHLTGKLYVGGKNEKNPVEYEISIFAVVETDATNEAIFAPTEIDVSETLEFIEKNCLYSVSTRSTGELFAMSTCKYPDTADRTIVVGYLQKQTK